MFQIITELSMEPVTGEGEDKTHHVRIQARQQHRRCLGWSKQVTQIQAVTDLLHGAAEVHARHSILVSLEVSLQGWIRLCRQ